MLKSENVKCKKRFFYFKQILLRTVFIHIKLKRIKTIFVLTGKKSKRCIISYRSGLAVPNKHERKMRIYLPI